MNNITITILFLLVWSIIQVVLSIWGLGLLSNTCQNLSLFTQLRINLIISAAISTFLFCILMCNQYCHEDEEDTFGLTPYILLGTTSTIVFMENSIYNNINSDNCNAKDTDNFKLALMYAGIVPSSVCIAISLGIIIMAWRKHIAVRRKASAVKDLARTQKRKEKEEKEAKEQEEAEKIKKTQMDLEKEMATKRRERLIKARVKAEEEEQARVKGEEQVLEETLRLKAEETEKLKQERIRTGGEGLNAEERNQWLKAQIEKRKKASDEVKIKQLTKTAEATYTSLLEKQHKSEEITSEDVKALELAEMNLNRAKEGKEPLDKLPE